MAHWTSPCFYMFALHCFYLKLLLFVCYMAYLIHICLLSCDAILLAIKSALSLEEEE